MKRILISILYYLLTVYSVFAQLPIKVERTISFTTEEGSNMSVDLSPDGKTIVFDLLGDLYTLPSKGGKATQITRGIAVNSYPVWSPKGDKIAYLSDASGDDRLTVMDISENGHQTFSEKPWRAPVWIGAEGWLTTPSLFFRAYPLYHLSGAEVQLPKDIYDIVGSSADGKRIYYKETAESGVICIYQYDVSTGVKKTLVELPKREAQGIKVSHEASLLSYLIRDGVSCSLILVNVASKNERLLAKWEQNVQSMVGLENYCFSADSKKILIGYGGKIHKIELETGKDEVIPFIANVKVDMGKLNDVRFKIPQDSLQVKYMRSACASPNGKHLVFAALNKVYIMDLPNGKPRVLVNQPFSQFHPSWSPDSRWIAYVSWNDKDFGQVWKVKFDGSGLEQVTQGAGFYHYPFWSPDGQSITVNQATSAREGRPILIGRDCDNVIGKLLSVNLKDRNVRVIADSISVINRVVYATDGESLIYKPDIRTSRGKYLLSVNNKLEKKTFAVAKPSSSFQELTLRQIALSPDGRYIVFTNEENLHLVPVAPTGTPTVLYDRTKKLPIIRFARGGFDPHWEQGGKMLNWSFANQYFEIDPDKIIAEAVNAAEERAKSGESQSEIVDVEITPDKTVTIDLKVPQKIGKGLLALKNVRIITMKGNQVIENGTVLIKNGRFLSVGKNTEIKIPEGAKIIDLAGKTIMPGLIDLHDHIYPHAEIFPQQEWNFIAGLAYGTTTGREPSGGHDYFGYEEALATGQMTGPRFFNVSHAVRDGLYHIANLKEARIVVQNRARMGGISVKQYTLPTRLERQNLLLACEEAGLNMTNEVDKEKNGFIGHIKDGTAGIEHNPYWGEAYNDVIQLAAKSGTYLTATLQVAYGTQVARNQFLNKYEKPDEKLARFYSDGQIKYRQEELKKLKIYAEAQEELPPFTNQSKIDARIRHAGGRVTMGSHGEDPGLGAHFEIWALQMGGLTNLEALQAATIMAAGALGMQEDLGSIEPGKIADLIILNKNPLDNIRNTIEIQSVMKDGVLYDGNTLDEIWPKAKKFNYYKSY